MNDLFENENTIYWPRKAGLRKLLGDLEIAVMEQFWRHSPGSRMTVRAIYDAGFTEKSHAYTTIMTTIQRLAAKGVLEADKAVYPHQFWAPLSQEDFTRKAVGQVLDDLLADFAEPALAYLEEAADQGAPEANRLLDELHRRRRLGEG